MARKSSKQYSELFTPQYNLEKLTNKQIRETNKRLDKLSQKYATKNQWATNIMLSKFETIKPDFVDKKGRLKQVSNKTKLSELRNISRITQQFLESKTSTIAGIRETKLNRKEGLERILGVKLTNKETADIQKLFSDKDFNNIADKIGYKETLTLLTDAHDNSMNKEKFIDSFKLYLDFGNDNDLKRSISKLYNKNKEIWS